MSANRPLPYPGPTLRRVSSRALPVVDETSAGGLVVDVQNGQAMAAVIARRNRGSRLEWCLPKGHLEGSETPPEAAVREISEETGIEGRVLRHLASIDYWFTEAEDVAWVPLSEVSRRLAYPNERRIVAAARRILVGDG